MAMIVQPKTAKMYIADVPFTYVCTRTYVYAYATQHGTIHTYKNETTAIQFITYLFLAKSNL